MATSAYSEDPKSRTLVTPVSSVLRAFSWAKKTVTDDCRASYESLRARGVEFTEVPEERPYGVDAGFRDPSGNSFRLTQVADFVNA